jgi:hypothetical protein
LLVEILLIQKALQLSLSFTQNFTKLNKSN